MYTAVVVTMMAINVGYQRMSVDWVGQVDMVSGRFIIDRLGGSTNHRDGRKRLNRKAQCQQHDENKFAPVGHNARV